MRSTVAFALLVLATLSGGRALAQEPRPALPGLPPAVEPGRPLTVEPGQPPAAEPGQPGTADVRIVWEVRNRFRLFRRESDFLEHVAADQGDGILAAERRMAAATDGQGWARSMVDHLCVDRAGFLMDTCERDGVKESYLAPIDHRITANVANPPANARCTWTFADDDKPQQITVPCEEEVRARIRYGVTTIVTVDIAGPDNAAQLHLRTEMAVRDLLIAGIGDSVASGEGNPDVPVALSDDGFCFRRFLGSVRSEYFRPGRAGFRGNKSCETQTTGGGAIDRDWNAHAARWMNAGCHRSLYGYQLRAALALAVENPHAAVTFLPLACTGASIDDGLIGDQRAREIVCPGGGRCSPSTMPAQIALLRTMVAKAKRQNAARKLDLVLLTVGANDIGFSELVADVILESGTERVLFRRSGLIQSPEEAQAALVKDLPGAFARLRAALRPLVGGDLSRVIYVSYPDPTRQADGSPCPGGRDGFDIHPAFSIDAAKMRQASRFVSGSFLPRLKALALCTGGTLCKSPETDRMTVVDDHQSAFAGHAICARAATDPAFDNDCFSAKGESFRTSLVEGASHPLVCDRAASEFRPYASRARWIRTANDSYFTAMTYPEGISSFQQPTDIHDATWGAMSAVYGGAVHPTAEGHAAMADAALVAMRRVLGLAGPLPIVPADAATTTPTPTMPEQ